MYNPHHHLHPSPPPPPRTPAYAHNSRFLRVHSFTPSSLSSPSSELQVLCTLFTAALSDSTPGAAPSPPKTIRLCFSSLPLATRVERAPPNSIVPSGVQGAQDLALSCKIPTRKQVQAAGIFHSSEVEGRVSLYCEILGGGGSALGEAVVERVWYGDFDYEEAEEEEDGERSSSSGWHQVPAVASRKRAASDEDDDLSPRSRQRFSSNSTDPSSLPGLDVQFAGTHSRGRTFSYNHPPDPNYPYAFQGPPQPQHLPPPPSFHSHTPTSLSPPSPHESGFPNYNSTASLTTAPPPPTLASFQQLPPPPPPPPQQTYPVRAQASRSNSPPPPPAPAQPSNVPKGLYGERATVGSKKASLELHGDLFTMAIAWNEEEWNARRRLVQFWRKMEGSVIHASFAPISQADYAERAIVISCIFREETNECYVTSVDAIYLLEGLIGARFSIEEKNRVRRNLQRCKPDTISKTKPATEDFFAVLMNFPTPKPRHIEKDIKVFKWKDFAGALERTVAKYSIAFTDGSSAPSPPTNSSNAASTSEAASEED